MMTNRKDGTLYVGVTAWIRHRVHQHRTGTGSEFVRQYRLTRLVWCAWFDDVREAIACEKRLKHMKRAEKVRLIHEANPEWSDLYETLL